MRSPAKAWYRLLAYCCRACPDGSGTDRIAAQDEGKILRINQLVYPDVVDPQKSSFAKRSHILTLAYEGLTRFDTDLKTVPAAAESWEYNEDATQLTFHFGRG